MCEMKIFLYVLMTSVFMTKGQSGMADKATAGVKIVVTDESLFGGCRSKDLSVEFEEVMSTLTGAVYKRAVVLECLMGLEAIDEKKYNMKTCLDAAADAGYNIFMLDGETCKVTNATFWETDASDGTIAVYAVEMLGPGEVVSDSSLSFTVSDVKRGDFKITIEDSSGCSSDASYKVEVIGETVDVPSGGTEDVTVDPETELQPCVEIEIVLKRYVNNVQIGQPISLKTRTYQELPLTGYPVLTYTPTGTTLEVSWDLLNCWGYVEEIIFKRDDGVEFAIAPPEHSITWTSCSDMLPQYQIGVKFANDTSPLPFSPSFSPNMTGLDMPLILEKVESATENGLWGLKVTFTDGLSCGSSVTYQLGVFLGTGHRYFLLDANNFMEDPGLTPTITCVLRRLVNNNQLGSLSNELQASII